MCIDNNNLTSGNNKIYLSFLEIAETLRRLLEYLHRKYISHYLLDGKKSIVQSSNVYI